MHLDPLFVLIFLANQILIVKTTGIGYTGGVNVFDVPLVENTASTTNLEGLLINVSTDDVYIISYYGNTNSTVASFDVMASISYQINN